MPLKKGTFESWDVTWMSQVILNWIDCFIQYLMLIYTERHS